MDKPEVVLSFRTRLFHWFLAALIAPIYTLLKFTWRIEEKGPPEVLEKYVGKGEPCIYAHWHGDELVLIGYYSFRRLAVLSSLSKDGSIMAKALTLMGYKVFRGSSSRGGARGLLGMIQAVRDGYQSSLAVDGPKGPIYEVKPGVVKLAVKTGQPIVPVRTRAERAWYIPRAWNKSYVPKPFTRVMVEYSEPILASSGDLDLLCSQVKSRLDSLPAQS
jgi:lysophospholipid acyltransferase (LPLAT)-like uncharacterized protein